MSTEIFLHPMGFGTNVGSVATRARRLMGVLKMESLRSSVALLGCGRSIGPGTVVIGSGGSVVWTASSYGGMSGTECGGTSGVCRMLQYERIPHIEIYLDFCKGTFPDLDHVEGVGCC